MEATGECNSPLEDSGRYEDDEFEEQEKLDSSGKHNFVGQVHPLLSAPVGASKPVANASAPEPAKVLHGADAEDDYGEDYDDFEESQSSVGDLKVVEEASESGRTSMQMTTSSVFVSDAHPDSPVDTTSDNDIDDHSHEVRLPALAARDEVERVRMHAHRGEETALPLPLPPPAPVQDSLLISEQRAMIAAKRVVEYRENRRQIAAQETAKAAVTKKKREQFRASNRKIYEQMGVSNRSYEQRYADLQEEKKLLAQHEKACRALEENQRWYNRKVAVAVQAGKQKRQTPAHTAHLQARYTDASKMRQRAAVEQAQVIKARQADLRKRALAIASKCTRTEYTRGSYLLSRTIGNNSSLMQRSPSSLLSEPPALPPCHLEQEAA